MKGTTQTVFDAAMALTDPERLLLVERLLDELSPDDDTMSDDELEKELNRRKTEFEEGRANPISWSQLRAEE